ncbi:helix-turn-helix domain-containing protein [Hymenobacter cellulosivorans]|uniref:Helix-turn-helix domain-containing protein n=1 Tax=Hymenobacter cellulosivorans TaxID=2932249 RepID=A0ABY4F7R5_9BACT|nr:helix-turn-helix domain-containing protein [Hymenobacter cellulosivorans]UOQ52246.1 helix-turn-helix domain-containing protein [Hymenobacter cellulosivorans]
MKTAIDFRPAPAALPPFDIHPLAWLRQQPAAPQSQRPGSALYTLILVDEPSLGAGPAILSAQASGELYLSRPGQPALATVPARAQGQVLRFTDEFVGLAGHERELLLFQLFHPAATEPLQVPAEQATDMAFLLTSMQRQAAGATLLREDLLRSYLKTLLLYCSRLRQQQSPPTPLLQAGLLGRFQQLLEANYTTWKSVAEYAQRLHVTANHLSVSIRKETGQPASEHIRQRIVLEAKRLITLSDVPLKEVAYQLGFEDVAHFSKLFKRCTGLTFSQFKQQTRAQYHPLQLAVA